MIRLRIGNREKEFPEKTILSDALNELGFFPETPCGGRGICGKCSVRIKSETGISDVLSCRFEICSDTEVIDFREEKRLIPTPFIPADSQIGIAIDIGTTSIQAAAVNLSTGSSFIFANELNSQRRFGHDVISRIHAAEKNGEKLHQLITSQISSIIEDFCKLNKIKKEAITKIAVAGNSVMTYLLAGKETLPFGKAPYSLPVLDLEITDQTIGMKGFSSEIKVIPLKSAFLGGDFTGGLALVYRMMNRGEITDEPTLFIDLGTNGEIFVTDFRRVFSTSCAMGPALEGETSCGVTARNGAITHVNYDSYFKRLSTEMIGSERAIGITGTAIIDIIAILLKNGGIDKNGALYRNPLFEIASEGNESRFSLTNDIYLTQSDIRSIQLAKGASLAASRILLKEAGIEAGRVRNVLIAGALGENLNIENFKKLSFLPEFTNAEYKLIGNSSLESCVSSITDAAFFDEIKELRKITEVVELSGHPLFNEVFIDSLGF